MKTLRMEVVYFVVDSSIDDKELEHIAFYKNQNKTILLKVDRRQRAKFDGLRTLILNKDYNTIVSLHTRRVLNRISISCSLRSSSQEKGKGHRELAPPQ